MPHTLGQAANAVGKNRTTILRAIKAGKLSATHDAATGAWTIEPVELHRLYPPSGAYASAPAADAHLRNGSTPAAMRELHARLADKDAVIDDLRRRLDAEAEERRRLTAVLTDLRAAPPPARRRWWPWRRL